VTWLVVVLSIIDAALIFSAAAQTNAVLDHLRTRHEARWRALGAPALRGSLLSRRYHSRTETPYQRFLRDGSYRSLGDAEFTAKVERGRILDRWAWRATLLLLACVVLVQLQQRRKDVRDIRDLPPPPAPPGAL